MEKTSSNLTRLDASSTKRNRAYPLRPSHRARSRPNGPEKLREPVSLAGQRRQKNSVNRRSHTYSFCRMDCGQPLHARIVRRCLEKYGVRSAGQTMRYVAKFTDDSKLFVLTGGCHAQSSRKKNFFVVALRNDRRHCVPLQLAKRRDIPSAKIL